MDLLWIWRQTGFSFIRPFLSSDLQHSDRGSGHALPRPALEHTQPVPHTAAKAPHLLPRARRQEGHVEASTRSPHGPR